MNRNATAALALLLASAATVTTWKLAWNGPAYARVLSAKPVTVVEPHYADVVEAVPLRGGGDKPLWSVAYRDGPRVGRVRVREKPGDQVRVGNQRRVIGYDVAWRWRERFGVVRLGTRPGARLPVERGAVVATPAPGRRSG